MLFSTDTKQKTGITSFQAFAMALSGRVGTGNIVGVATAIGYGGPGSIVWMWIIAFFGSGTAFAESTLAQIYKEEHNGQFRGGPSYYIEKGLRCRWLAMVFAILTVIAMGIQMPPVQCNGIAISCANTFGIQPYMAGIVVAVLIGLVIIGGVKRIAKVAQIVAPFMALLYILLAIVVLICNARLVPGVFTDMIRSALGFNEALGGILGSTIAWGVKRGIYSNEAGQGTGAIVAGAAKVSHPAKQGLVQAFSVYVDTLLVCTATAIMILACKTYNVYDATGNLLVSSPCLPLGRPDVSYTSAALGTVIGPNMGNILIAFALFFFAFTTILAYYYYAETNLVYLFSRRSNRKGLERGLIWVLRICVIGSVFFGSLYEAKAMWDLGDIAVGSMAWINIIAILLLSRKAFKTLNSYERQEKNGKEPKFVPKELGIKNADFWEDNSEEMPSHDGV